MNVWEPEDEEQEYSPRWERISVTILAWVFVTIGGYILGGAFDLFCYWLIGKALGVRYVLAGLACYMYSKTGYDTRVWQHELTSGKSQFRHIWAYKDGRLHSGAPMSGSKPVSLEESDQIEFKRRKLKDWNDKDEDHHDDAHELGYNQGFRLKTHRSIDDNPFNQRTHPNLHKNWKHGFKTALEDMK